MTGAAATQLRRTALVVVACGALRAYAAHYTLHEVVKGAHHHQGRVAGLSMCRVDASVSSALHCGLPASMILGSVYGVCRRLPSRYTLLAVCWTDGAGALGARATVGCGSARRVLHAIREMLFTRSASPSTFIFLWLTLRAGWLVYVSGAHRVGFDEAFVDSQLEVCASSPLRPYVQSATLSVWV